MTFPPPDRICALLRVAMCGCLTVAIVIGLAACASTFSPARMPAASGAAAPPPPIVPQEVIAAPPAPVPIEPAVTAPALPPPVIEPLQPPAAAPVASSAFSPPARDDRVSPPPAEQAKSTPPSSATARDARSAAAPEGSKIVLVLPLDSPTFARAAEAVAAGFNAAAQLANAKATVIAHGDDDVLTAVDKAKALGAAVLVGPLLRDDVRQLASAGTALPWTIALNQLDEGASLPDHVYMLTLSIEGEARQIARAMHDDGAEHVAIVSSDSPLQRRFVTSFTGEWILQGGGPPATYGFQRTPESPGTLRRELARSPPDAILLAVEASDASVVKPYLGQAPVYASSQINDRQPPEVVNDLEGIRFVEVPWLAQPDSPTLAAMPQREWPNATLARLYALGIDALQVALAFEHGPPTRLELDGATGHLTLEPNRQIVREGRLMRFEAGRIVAAQKP